MLNNSLISRNNDFYKTHFVFKDKKVTFNDREMDFSYDETQTDDETITDESSLDENMQTQIQ